MRIWSGCFLWNTVNYGGRHFCPKIMYEKLTKCPNFTWYLAKNYQSAGFFMTFSRKLTSIRNFCMIIARKNIFPVFLWGGGRSTASPYPTPMQFTSAMHIQIFYVLTVHAYSTVACSRLCSQQSSKWLRTTTSWVWRGCRGRRRRQRSLPCRPARRHRHGSVSPVTRRPSATHLVHRDHLSTCRTPAWPWRRRTSCISRYATKVGLYHKLNSQFTLRSV